MANYSLYTGSSVVDYFYGEESTTGLPVATIASAHADTSAVTWGSVGGVVGFPPLPPSKRKWLTAFSYVAFLCMLQ